MDSPEATLPAPSAPIAADESPPAVQESPFLTYVNTFSPIKAPSSLLAPSAIRELNFPSPSPVFTSPHLNPVRRDKFLKRCSDSRKFSLDYARDIGEELEKASHYGCQISQSAIFPCSTNNSQMQSSNSPSANVDDFLADPVEDSCNMSALSNLCLRQPLTDESAQCEGSTSLPTESHLEGVRQRNSSFDDDSTTMGVEQMKNDELEIIESLMLPSHNGENPIDLMDTDVSVCKNDEVKLSEIVENDGLANPFDPSGHHNTDVVDMDGNLEMQPKSLHAHPEEASKSQWGGCQLAYAMRRRLEFVPLSAPTMENPSNLRSDIDIDQTIPEAESPTRSFDVELQNTSHGTPNTIAYSSPDGSFFKNDQEQSDSLIPRTTGIGLHLNSIGKALSNNAKLSAQSVDMDQGSNSDSPTAPQQSGVLVNASEEEDATLPLLPAYVDQFMTPRELIEISPKKKSKKSPENDGCKRCNCKKSKCLKLYCDCFAAGVYCTDLCSCQGCLNRLEHQEIVMETRQQIENRNPLAFAPKVVVQDASVASRPSGDADKNTPASARHKRGCNCKRSQCLKKYCECFQSKVGCSSGCRCEGCKNTYGRKEGSANSKNELIKKTWNEKHGREYYTIADEDDADVDLAKQGMPLSLSPLTPLVDGSNAIIQSKSQFLNLKYQSSPESKSSTRDVADSEAVDIFGDAKVNAPSVQRTSPMTPTPRFGQTRFALESSSSDCGPVNVDEDDSTPDILLGNDAQPGNGPRVGSPNKKRVSPPHQHLEEGSSRGMKSRKFILKSVPSFPCLTPYSKDCKTQPP